MWVQSLGQEDPLEKEMATHSSILAWRIPWTEGPGGLQSWGRKELDTTEQLHGWSITHGILTEIPGTKFQGLKVKVLVAQSCLSL